MMMARIAELVAFPAVAAVLAGGGAMAVAMLGVAPTVATALGFGAFAAIIALRNWAIMVTDRPLLADELTVLHERAEGLNAEASDFRELLAELAGIVEDSARREQEAFRSLSARLSALEHGEPQGERGAPAAPAPEVAAGLSAVRNRLDHFDARTRKLALAVERGFAAQGLRSPGAAAALTADRATERAAERLDAAAPKLTAAAEQERAFETRPEAAAERAGAPYALMLQAVFSMPEGEPRFFEAFTRRERADGAVADAADHIEPAKADGTIGLIDNVMLARSIAAAEQLRAAGRDVKIFCNLSMISLRDPGYLRAVLHFLHNNAELSERLIFEFGQLEIDEFDDPDIGILQKLRETGFVFSIDHIEDWSIDIANLSKLGFRYVKLDAANLLRREAESRGAVRRLIAKFEREGLILVVEKVETARDRERLEDAGARFLQGAALAEPRRIRVEDEAFAALESAALKAVVGSRPLQRGGAAGSEGGASSARSPETGFGADPDHAADFRPPEARQERLAWSALSGAFSNGPAPAHHRLD